MGALVELLRNGKKPIIGMVHLAALPGSVHYQEPFEKTEERAVSEFKTLSDCGFDGAILQNTGDVPALENGDEATIAFMTKAGLMLKQTSNMMIGINVLMNGSNAALAIAKAIAADFVRIKVNSGAVSTSTGIVQANPYAVLSFRNRIRATHIDMIGDLYDRTAAPVGEFPLEVLADLALRHADMRALVVSGYDHQDLIERLKLLRKKLPQALLVVGGGAKKSNLSELLSLSDGIIVGSSIKSGGGFLDPIDPEKASAFIEEADRLR